MKQYFAAIAIFVLLTACGNTVDRTATLDTISTPNTAAVKPVKKNVLTLREHNDDGQPYFAYIYTRNDSVINDIQSDHPLAFQGATNTVIQLDSSHHLTVIGSGINLYLNSKKAGRFPVVLMNAGKDSATIAGGYLAEDGSRPGIFPESGMITIDKMENNKCSGSFEAITRKNNEVFMLKGEFKNVDVHQ